MNNNSSELNSLLIATTVFAIGGLGLFMYNSENSSKSSKRTFDDGNESHSDGEEDETGSESSSDLSIGEVEFDVLDDDDVQDTDNPRAVSSKKGQSQTQTKRNSVASSKTKKRR